ncbi:hypothetical protein BpHYR1_030865 [Brachionus plicatilis]|uniref:Uncharacterized protein n=1 Tax=Brachionus plicatilis TaxID=10195 RepID=A0A3M7PX93_BRAPC|nr:hypothetical protein BpHYR1_030865 [Brachionus plicatilis]
MKMSKIFTLPKFMGPRLAAGVNGIRGNWVNHVNPIGQFFQPVSPENHTDGVVILNGKKVVTPFTHKIIRLSYYIERPSSYSQSLTPGYFPNRWNNLILYKN